MNIVLAHGILGFKTFLGIRYFNGVKERLETRFQAEVLVTEVDPVANVEYRGGQLRMKILEALDVTGATPTLDPNQKVHIVAHSMGGLDSRFILSPQTPDNIAERVASLTTIGTPHQGSPVADLCYALVDGKAALPFIGSLEEQVKEAFEKLIRRPLFDGLRDLTTAKAHDFNRDVTDADHQAVRYFCVAGIGRKNPFRKTCGFLLATYGYIKLKTGEDNDGMVPLSSAQRPGWEVLSEPWPADHFEEVGHNIDRGPDGKPTPFDYLGKYEEIVERLQAIKG